MDCAVLSQPYNHISFKRRKSTWYSVKDGNWTDPSVWQSNASKRWGYPGQNIPTPVFPQVGDDVYVNHNVSLSHATSTSIVINNLFISGTLTGSSATSNKTLVINGDLQATGSIDLTTGANTTINLYGVNNFITNFTAGTTSTINYYRAGDQFIMDLPYRNLGAGGSGAKYLTANTVVSGNYAGISNFLAGTSQNGQLECGSYNFTVNGTSNFSFPISKSGAGSLLFIGTVTFGNNLPYNSTIVGQRYNYNFSGNPTVEFRGGIVFQNIGLSVTPDDNSGSGTWKFTTNSQSISNTAGTAQPVFNCPISIENGITLTTTTTGSSVYYLNQPINATTSGGQLLNKGTIYFNSTSSLPSMTTGTFDRTTNANTVGYTMGASITLPYTTYYSLAVGGTGIKTAQATLNLPGSLTVIAGGSMEMSTFDLTVSTTATINGTLSKSLTGSVLFIGQVTMAAGTLDFTGNPSIEIRNGLSLSSANTFNGSCNLSFTTNNQSISAISGTSSIPYNTLISGAITLTNNSNNGKIVISGTLNGNNAASTFDNRTSGTADFQYRNTQRPMLTGILQTNAAANTFIYNKNGSQDISAGTYRTLQIGGTATPNDKTLQGNITVATAYSVTGNAVLVLNGFTKS